MPTATAAEPTVRPLVVSARRDGPRRAVSAQSVAVARVGFGLLAAASSARFLAKGWVETLYLAPVNHLTFPGFGWVRPWPTALMYAHVIALVVLGLAIAVGYRHRAAATLFVIGFTYVELIDATLYLNHYWFLSLMGVLMAVLPVGSYWSLDARLGRVPSSPVVEAWVVWALRAQVAVVYLFAGLAKLNTDWLVHAQPLRLWLADHTALPVIGPWMDEPLLAHLASWSGAVFDLTIVGWLLWPRSRPLAYAVVVGFHVATGLLFPIGIFPWVMAISALVFFEPDWPSRVGGRRRSSRPTAPPPRTGRGARRLLVGLAVLQLALPLRHYALPGNVRWNEQGYYLAWRVMLTEKAGSLEFLVTDPETGREWEVGPELVLTDWQITQAAIRPDLIRQTAALVEAHYGRDLEVRAVSWVSMNGRPAAPLIDPTVDLTGPLPEEWIRSSP